MQESNLHEARAVAGLQGDGTNSGTKNCGDLIDRLATTVLELLAAGPPPLPPNLLRDLERLLAEARG